MALDNEIIMIGIGFVFNYFVLYRKNKLLGNIGFFGLAFCVLSYGVGAVYSTIGFIMLIGSILNLIFDTINKWNKS